MPVRTVDGRVWIMDCIRVVSCDEGEQSTVQDTRQQQCRQLSRNKKSETALSYAVIEQK